jgi:signal transduction histidine kinase
MNPEINTLYCSDAQPTFLGLFDMSIAPDLLFYAYVPTIIILLFIGGILVKRDRFSLKSVSLFFLGFFFSLWMINEIIHWTVAYHAIIALSWKYTLTLISIIFTSIAWVIYSFFRESKTIQKLTYLQTLLPLVLLGLSSTTLTMPGYDYENCVGENGILWFIVYIFQILFFLFIWWYGKKIVYCQSEKSDFFIKKVILYSLSAVAIILAGTLMVSDLTEIYAINLMVPISIIGALEIIGFYSVRYQFFSFKSHQSELLIYTAIALVGSLFLVPNVGARIVILLFTLIALFILGKVVMRINIQEENRKKELEKVNATLQKLDATKNEFLSFATHQLRSPLTSLKWGLGTVAENVRNDPETATIVGQLRNTADDMISTVNDLLDISKIEQGGMTITKESIDIVELIERISEEYQSVARAKGLSFTFSTQLSTGMVLGDKTKLSQVFGNIIDNAIKYTSTGSIIISLVTEGNYYQVKITDTGNGISESEIKNLFTKFNRGDAGKKSGSGSGLGLYLAKKIVDLHSGTIRITSAGIGQGSTFSVGIPKND